MLRILDRYVIREVLAPFSLALALFTFILVVDPLMKEVQRLIEKGVGAVTILRILATLMPSALGVTIPVALSGRVAHRARPAVGKSQSGSPPGLRCEPDSTVAAGRRLLAGGLPGDGLRDDLGDAGRQPALPGAAGRGRGRQDRHRDKAEGILRGFPNLTFYFAGRSQGWRRVARRIRRRSARPDGHDSWSRRTDGWSSTRRPGRRRPDAMGTAAHMGPTRGAGQVEVQRFTTQTVEARPQRRVSENRGHARPPEMTISELQAEIDKKETIDQSPTTK